jgi:hypothetical protein
MPLSMALVNLNYSGGFKKNTRREEDGLQAWPSFKADIHAKFAL